MVESYQHELEFPIIERFIDYKIIGWITIAICLFCGFMSWRAEAVGISIMFFSLISVGIFILLFTGSLEFNSQYIKAVLPIGTYQIEWRDVKRIETDFQGFGLVFVGENKRLVTYGIGAFSKKNRGKIVWLIEQQRKKYNIEIIQTQKALYKMSKNTKID